MDLVLQTEILESRVKPTHALATLLAGLRPKPAVLVCASAIGIYGSRGDELLTEASSPGNGFLPEVCLAWERQRSRPRTLVSGSCICALVSCFRPPGVPWRRCCLSFAPGLGGRLGSGRQWMSWIALPDVLRAIEFALRRTASRGQ